jgi:hypothetical protein
VGVDADGGLVLDQVRGGVGVAVVELGLGGDGDVVVVLAEELGAAGGDEGGVGEDEGDGGVEEVEGEERFRRVCDYIWGLAMGPEQGAREGTYAATGLRRGGW